MFQTNTEEYVERLGVSVDEGRGGAGWPGGRAVTTGPPEPPCIALLLSGGVFTGSLCCISQHCETLCFDYFVIDEVHIIEFSSRNSFGLKNFSFQVTPVGPDQRHGRHGRHGRLCLVML